MIPEPDPRQLISFQGLRLAFSLRRNLRHLADPGSLPPVDGLRALSILWVIAFHGCWFLGFYLPPSSFRPLTSDPLLRLVWRGDLGVDVFFTISGFLIADLLLREHAASHDIAVGRFYLRRAMRLLPAYLVVLSIYCGLGLPRCDTAWANLLYVNNLLPVSAQCMAWSWSLAIEAQFYLLSPLLLLLCLALPRSPRRLLLSGLGAAALALPLWQAGAHGFTLPVAFFPSLDRAGFERFFDTFYDKPFTRFGPLLCGVLAALLRRRPPVLRWPAPAIAAAGLAIACICLYPSKDPAHPAVPRLFSIAFIGASRTIFSAAVAFALLLSLSEHRLGRVLRRVLGHKAWAPVAQLSYSAYLVHPICIIALLRTVESLGGPVGGSAGAPSHLLLLCLGLAGAALTFCAAAILYLLVERPFMNLRASS